MVVLVLVKSVFASDVDVGGVVDAEDFGRLFVSSDIFED
jgi:hypothetical protein